VVAAGNGDRRGVDGRRGGPHRPDAVNSPPREPHQARSRSWNRIRATRIASVE
jgi:hypothetical protein